MKPMTRSPVLTYLNGYSPDLKTQVQSLLDQEKTGAWLTGRYPAVHDFTGAKPLYDYAMAIKNQSMRSAPPISKVVYDDKIHVINNALGLHTYVSRVQGGKLKAKNEIRISSLFRKVPESFLRMILVHELATLNIHSGSSYIKHTLLCTEAAMRSKCQREAEQAKRT
jgi:predicted metal-dependent hydrolase